VKAIIEKHARTRRLPAITGSVVEPYLLPELEALDSRAGPHRAPLAGETPGRGSQPGEGEASLAWTAEAESRLERIPEGFLRNLAREQVERIALAVDAASVTELHADAGIAEARARMRDALGPGDSTSAPGCPFSGSGEARVGTTTDALNEVTAGFVEALGKRMTARRTRTDR
jgi:hypothetical protein